jgi:hypothetical protein
LTEIAVEKNSTVVFPLPIDLIAPLAQILRRAGAEVGEAEAPETLLPTAVPAAVEVANGSVLPLQS